MPPNPSPAAPAAAAAQSPEAIQQQLMVLQLLAQQGVPQDQWAGFLAALNPAAVPQPQGLPGWNQRSGTFNVGQSQSRDPRSRGRSRSRSPPGWNKGRKSPTYESYGGGSPGQGRGRTDRQRSPPGRREASRSPPKDVPKWVEMDASLGPDKIKGAFIFLSFPF
jgi:protein NRD1